jgi:RNA polymerase sigma-70 factor (ECF subfamily)
VSDTTAVDYEALTEPELVARLAAGDTQAARIVIRRNNQLLYRAAWSVLRDRTEAEDVVQEGYVKAFAAIDRFEHGSALSTWLTRIVVNEAIGRLRAAERRRRSLRGQGLALLEDYQRDSTSSLAEAPDAALLRRELAGLLQGAIARLPEAFRMVFVLLEIEDLSAAEASEVLGLKVETIRTRLFRARRHLRRDLGPELRRAVEGTLTFAGADCDALTARVLAAWDARRREQARE